MGNLAGIRINMFKTWKSNDSSSCKLCTLANEMGNKSDLKRHGSGAIKGRFVRKCALNYFRGDSVDVDINASRPASKIFDVPGCDGPVHLYTWRKLNYRCSI